MKTIFLVAAACAAVSVVRANATYFDLASGPLVQDWSNTSLITSNDNWSNVPSIIGYLGNGLTASTGINPQSLLAAGAAAVDVIANQTNTNITNGGVAEFQITNPTIAFQGSSGANAPFLLIHLNTLGMQNLHVSYLLRDLDGAADNAIQPIALQYRLGASGNFTNFAPAFVADATTGPNVASLTTPVNVFLPSLLDNQGQIQLRIITADALGSDEWVGIDDIKIAASTIPPSNVPETLPGAAIAAVLMGVIGLARWQRNHASV
jgi:uncharacterized protein